MTSIPPICERCGEVLTVKRVVWLELSNTDGKYYQIKDMVERSIPEGHISQGAFPFGSTCAKKQLLENKTKLK
jgi:hypothetical protein